jgi:hypothetical protein
MFKQILIVEVNDNIHEFEEQSDGWFSCVPQQLAINPDLTVCVTDPWYADHVCEAPTHQFQILSRS